MKKTSSLLLATVLAALTYLPAGAQLVSYPINSTSTQTPTVADSSTTTASDLTLGSGFAYGGNSVQGVNSVYGAYTTAVVYPTSLAGSVTANDYYTFTVAPTTGNMLDLTALDLSATKLVSQNRDREFTLESSVTGFGSSSGNILASYTTRDLLDYGSDVTLGSAFSALTKPVEFRIYLDDSPDGSNGAYESVALGGTIKVDGTAAMIPEPSTYALLGLGLAMLVITARNRRAFGV